MTHKWTVTDPEDPDCTEAAPGGEQRCTKRKRAASTGRRSTIEATGPEAKRNKRGSARQPQTSASERSQRTGEAKAATVEVKSELQVATAVVTTPPPPPPEAQHSAAVEPGLPPPPPVQPLFTPARRARRSWHDAQPSSTSAAAGPSAVRSASTASGGPGPSAQGVPTEVVIYKAEIDQLERVDWSVADIRGAAVSDCRVKLCLGEKAPVRERAQWRWAYVSSLRALTVQEALGVLDIDFDAYKPDGWNSKGHASYLRDLLELQPTSEVYVGHVAYDDSPSPASCTIIAVQQIQFFRPVRSDVTAYQHFTRSQTHFAAAAKAVSRRLMAEAAKLTGLQVMLPAREGDGWAYATLEVAPASDKEADVHVKVDTSQLRIRAWAGTLAGSASLMSSWKKHLQVALDLPEQQVHNLAQVSKTRVKVDVLGLMGLHVEQARSIVPDEETLRKVVLGERSSSSFLSARELMPSTRNMQSLLPRLEIPAGCQFKALLNDYRLDSST